MNEWMLMTTTAVSVGFLHTVIGVDHYLPFVALAKSRRWNTGEIFKWTLLGGFGHIAGALAVGLAALAFGATLEKMKLWDAVRGDTSAWVLAGFGLAYFFWGLREAFRRKAGCGQDVETAGRGRFPAGILCTVLVVGPCEPMIPLLMVPASAGDVFLFIWIALVFGAVTIGTMVSLAVILSRMSPSVTWRGWPRFEHAAAGLVICGCGLMVQWMGW